MVTLVSLDPFKHLCVALAFTFPLTVELVEKEVDPWVDLWVDPWVDPQMDPQMDPRMDPRMDPWTLLSRSVEMEASLEQSSGSDQQEVCVDMFHSFQHRSLTPAQPER